MKKLLFNLLIVASTLLLFSACGGGESAPESSDAGPKPKSMVAKEVDPMDNKGIGPISKVELGAEIDQALAATGKEVYDLKCSACHKATEKFIGPAPAGIMERRSPEWIMNMILNPEEMTMKDPIAKQLLIDYNMSPMANQSLTEEEARSILEYFRTL
ncbi:MAG: cytochrome c [Bacteroidetes bacterium]|nr:cytochrome c [Bacteroidota bacterium]